MFRREEVTGASSKAEARAPRERGSSFFLSAHRPSRERECRAETHLRDGRFRERVRPLFGHRGAGTEASLIAATFVCSFYAFNVFLISYSLPINSLLL